MHTDADTDAGGIAIALLHLSAGTLKMKECIAGLLCKFENLDGQTDKWTTSIDEDHQSGLLKKL